MEVRTDEVARRASPRSFDALFREEFPRVVRAAAFVAGDLGAGEDAAQEAFIRVHSRWERLPSDEYRKNFVYRVAINLARSHVRKHLRLRPYGLASHESDVGRDPSAARLDWLEIVDAVAPLTGRQRAVLALVDYLGYDADAAARLLRIAPATVRVHLKRARDAVRERLTPSGEER